MYQKGFEEGLAGLGLDDKSDCESEDESNFRRPSSHSALKQKNGGKGKPSGLFEHLAAHGREFSKLSKHAAQLKRLSGSVMNVLNLDDAQDTRQAKSCTSNQTCLFPIFGRCPWCGKDYYAESFEGCLWGPDHCSP